MNEPTDPTREASYAVVEADLRRHGVTAVRFVKSGAVRVHLAREALVPIDADHPERVIGAESPTLIGAVAALHAGQQ